MFLAVRGIAICIVVAAHAAIGLVAAELNLTPISSLTLSVLGFWQIVSPGKFAVLELARCAVPLFLFLAGYHLARSNRSWLAIWNNSKKLLIPMIFWSLIAWGISWRKGADGWSIAQFLTLFFSGKAQLGYYFIILIIQYFVLSRWLVPAIEKKPKLIITGSVLLQLSTHVYGYVYLFGKLGFIETSEWVNQFGSFPEYLFPRFIISFTLGIWASLNIKSFKQITEKYFFLLTIMAIITATFLFIETGLIFGAFYNLQQVSVFKAASYAWAEWKMSTAVWTIAAVFFIIAACRRWLPFKKRLETFGKYSYQIFLLHGMVLFFITLVSYKYGTNFHWYGMTGFLIRFFSALFLPLIAINIIRKWAPRRIQMVLLGS